MTRTHKIGGALAALLLLLLGVGLAADVIARSALESSLSRTFGTEASVESVDLGILSGKVTLEGLSVANPEGFGDAPFHSLRRGRLAAGLASVFRDTVEVRELTLEGAELGIVQRGTGSNLGPILASVKRAREGDGTADETAYRIGQLVIRDVTARIRVGAGPGGEAETTVKIPEIRLEDVGSGRGGAVALSELAGLTLQAMLGAVARESGGLPGSLRDLLRSQAGRLPGGLQLRLPGSDEGENLRDQAEEELKQMIPGRDGNG